MVDLINGMAETIERALLDVLKQANIPKTSIHSFGSDGAAVVTGRVSGVQARLKQHNPEILSLHCGAHRIALASSQAATAVPYLRTFDSHLVALYYHFANSAVHEVSLHEVYRRLWKSLCCV